MATQDALFDRGHREESAGPKGSGEQPGRNWKPKLKPIDRSQGFLRPVIVDELVPPAHKVRAIWDLSGQFDLSGFTGEIKSKRGRAGRAAWDPRLLLSVGLRL
ncbi:MAG: hypothetical protein ACKV2U_29630 [Bryobacteraceae bacterium]